MSVSGSERVLLIGGTSEIGLAILRRLAVVGTVRPYLVGRDQERLEQSLAELGVPNGACEELDADDLESHGAVLRAAFEAFGGFEVVILAVGVLGAQAPFGAAREEVAEVLRVNFLGAGSLLIEATRLMRERGHGTMIVLSSVAAERARAGNAVYGAAKAGLDALAQGLGDALAGSGARMLVVRPGFVSTRMTAGLDPAPMATTPEAVAEATVAAICSLRHQATTTALSAPSMSITHSTG